VFPHLKNLFDPNASHRFFVDGSPVAADANLGTSTSPQWSTVLVGSTGAGGNGYFALNVENPAQPKPLWEAGPDVSGFENLGATLGQASIVRMQSGDWVAIFANGYNATDNKAHLYIVNLENGARLADILLDAGESEPNGLSSPLAADNDRDGSVDTVYAGDMLGNLWKIDLSAASPGDWPSSVSAPLFKAVNANDEKQPIYAAPNAMLLPNSTTNEVLVFFGTGKFFEKSDDPSNGHNDLTDTRVQTFYGIRDNGTSGQTLTRSALVEQTISQAPTNVGNYSAAELRVLSKNSVDYGPGGKSGFYIDLSVKGVNQGERVLHTPVLLYDRVIFTTLIPSLPGEGRPCDTGSTYGWLMQVDFLTGGQTKNVVADLNGDGVFDNSDKASLPGGDDDENISGTPIDNSGGRLVVDTKDCDWHHSTVKDKWHIACTPPGAGRESWQQFKGR
jgi:type IV pilus assembly protein PilY1